MEWWTWILLVAVTLNLAATLLQAIRVSDLEHWSDAHMREHGRPRDSD